LISDVQVTLAIPEELARTAEEFGFLDSEHLVALLEAEVERKVAQLTVEEVNAVRAKRREVERDVAAQRARDMMAKLDAIEPKLAQQEIDQRSYKHG
jgi:hypothetical protein